MILAHVGVGKNTKNVTENSGSEIYMFSEAS